MIIDSFLYYNEIEILELRLKVLYNYVDKFVIIEGDHTFKGDPKPFRCKQDLLKLGFNSDSPKIEVIEVNLPPPNSKMSSEDEDNYWDILRKNQISLCEDDDILILADIDELPNPHYINDHVNFLINNPDFILCNRSWDLQYQVNYAISAYGIEPNVCNVPFIAKGSFWKNNNPQQVRNIINSGGHIDDFPFNVTWFDEDHFIGWHLSWMGDVSRRLKKINAHSWHMESEDVKNSLRSDGIKEQIKNFNPKLNKGDLLGRNWGKGGINTIHLIEFDYTELFNIIGDLPHIKTFLLGDEKN
tara:strand:+ start:2933 stop:3832 length:900 start_codon:yes stop_codon:yes gene_type:complete